MRAGLAISAALVAWALPAAAFGQSGTGQIPVRPPVVPLSAPGTTSLPSDELMLRRRQKAPGVEQEVIAPTALPPYSPVMPRERSAKSTDALLRALDQSARRGTMSLAEYRQLQQYILRGD